MSQVMSALQDSEQSRQAMLTPYQNLSNGRNEEHRPQLKLSYMLMLGVLPIVAVASYLGLEAYRANEVRLISEQHPIVSAAAIQADTPIRIQAQSQARARARPKCSQNGERLNRGKSRVQITELSNLFST